MRIGAVALFVVWVILAIWGTRFANFLPTDLVVGLSVALGVVGAACGAFVALMTPDENSEHVPATMNQNVRAFALSVVVGSLVWAVGSVGLAWLWTVATGKVGDQVFIVEGWRNQTRNDCSGPRLIESPGILCLDASYWEGRLPPGSKVVVSGPISVFGISADRVSIDGG